jgi:hypothetical protein
MLDGFCGFFVFGVVFCCVSSSLVGKTERGAKRCWHDESHTVESHEAAERNENEEHHDRHR